MKGSSKAVEIRVANKVNGKRFVALYRREAYMAIGLVLRRLWHCYSEDGM